MAPQDDTCPMTIKEQRARIARVSMGGRANKINRYAAVQNKKEFISPMMRARKEFSGIDLVIAGVVPAIHLSF